MEEVSFLQFFWKNEKIWQNFHGETGFLKSYFQNKELLQLKEAIF